jgi:hypothetical protein
MTRVSCRFLTRPKKRTNCQKKRRVGCLRSCFQRVVVLGKSMVGLEGKYKGNRMLFRVFVVYGDRGFTYKCIVKRVGNLVLRQ